jgi:hypothetical protein
METKYIICQGAYTSSLTWHTLTHLNQEIVWTFEYEDSFNSLTKVGLTHAPFLKLMDYGTESSILCTYVNYESTGVVLK